jgi:hypothetical protein
LTHRFRVFLGRLRMKKSSHRHLLLRPRHQRLCRNAAEHRDEVAPFHSITSSARRSRNVEPKCLRGLEVDHKLVPGRRLHGRSAGFSPLRMRSSHWRFAAGYRRC